MNIMAQPTVSLEEVDEQIGQITSLVLPEVKQYKKRPMSIKFGRWYFTELNIEDYPPRLIVSPIPFSKALSPVKIDIAIKGWFGPGKADRIWTKLVALTQHARAEKRIGVYLLFMCRAYVRLGVDPRKVEQELSAEDIKNLIECFAKYELLMIGMQLEDSSKRLHTYETVKEERRQSIQRMAENYAADLASKWDFTKDFRLPSKQKKGAKKLIPDWETFKSFAPWLIMFIFIGLAILYWYVTLAPIFGGVP